jgi:hypothetical protein
LAADWDGDRDELDSQQKDAIMPTTWPFIKLFDLHLPRMTARKVTLRISAALLRLLPEEAVGR